MAETETKAKGGKSEKSDKAPRPEKADKGQPGQKAAKTEKGDKVAKDKAAKGEAGGDQDRASGEATALAYLMRGVHW